MIEFSHVYKTYSNSVHALKNIDLKIDGGEFVFLTGPSGAGKSTLFKMISAFDQITSGEIHVAGYDLAKMTSSLIPEFRRKIGVVFQDFKLIPEKTVFENVAMPLIVRGESGNAMKRRVFEVLDQVGLGHKYEEYPLSISGGEQQRTAIARAIVHKPGVLIADEPTGNLDPALAEEIMNLMEKVSAQGTTVLIATHDHEMVRRRNKRVIQIDNGTIVGDLR